MNEGIAESESPGSTHLKEKVRLKLWSILAVLGATLMVSGSGWADERPRNTTLAVTRTEVARHANGHIDTFDIPLKIYYGSDGTAYVQLGRKSSGESYGVTLSPNASSGSHSAAVGPRTLSTTVSIIGQMSNLNITYTAEFCDQSGLFDGRGVWCLHTIRAINLRVSGTTCSVIGGTFNMNMMVLRQIPLLPRQ
jgi:hypothetical protein